MPKYYSRSSGKFAPECRNVHHQGWGSSDGAKLLKFRRISAADRKYIQLKEIAKPKTLSKFELHVCQDCIDYSHRLAIVSGEEWKDIPSGATATRSSTAADREFLAAGDGVGLKPREPNKTDSKDSDSQGHFKHILDSVLSLSKEELSNLAFEIGKSQRQSVLHDISHSSLTTPPSADDLLEHDSKQWMLSRNDVVVSFLSGVSNFDVNSTSSNFKEDVRRSYALNKAVEQAYFAANPKVVLPNSFSENILIYSVSKSKILPNAIGAISPSGSYQVVRRWLDCQAANELPPLEGDLIFAFDNDQVVGRTYHVRTDNKVRASVITSVCAYSEPGCLQKDFELRPSNWRCNLSEQATNICNPKSDINILAGEVHYKELYGKLSERIEKVTKEQRQSEDGLTDEIDLHVKQISFDKEWKLCGVCSERNRRTKRVCEHCGAKLVRPTAADVDCESESAPTPRMSVIKESLTRISFSPEKSASTSTSSPYQRHKNIKARDPIFVNPNSQGTIAAVFRQIGKDAKVRQYCKSAKDEDEIREWLQIVCDGLPYSIALNILSNFFECRLCNEKMQGEENFVSHMHEIHANAQFELCDNLEFGWILLKIGHGHYEMNMARSFLSLNWEVFMKHAAKVLGFETERAQQYAKSGSDHHKTWELLQVVYNGGIDELLLPYVRECISEDRNPTPEGYLKWSKQVKDSSYAYFQEQMMTYAQSLANLRKGLRSNNADLVVSGRIKYAPIFHARNHPKYQAIELTELATYLSAPTKVKEFIRKHSSFSASDNKGEDLDFQLENLNKQSKAWIPRGVPTEHDWKRIFRNLDKLSIIRGKTLDNMGQAQSTQERESAHKAREEDIMAWRTFLRESEYLTSPFITRSISSVSSEELNPGLLQLTNIGMERRKFFVSKLFLEVPPEKPDPAFVTKDECRAYHDINKQTKDKIVSRITGLVNSLSCEETKSTLMGELQQVRNKKKEELISFFYKVEELSLSNYSSDDD